MLSMPLRAVKMYRFIFGFQRLVWCPKWTPASRSCLSVTSGMRNERPVSTSASVVRRADLLRGNPAPSEGVLNARESIAAQSESETGAYAAGAVGFRVLGPRPRPADVRRARSVLQVGWSPQLMNSP